MFFPPDVNGKANYILRKQIRSLGKNAHFNLHLAVTWKLRPSADIELLKSQVLWSFWSKSLLCFSERNRSSRVMLLVCVSRNHFRKTGISVDIALLSQCIVCRAPAGTLLNVCLRSRPTFQMAATQALHNTGSRKGAWSNCFHMFRTFSFCLKSRCFDLRDKYKGSRKILGWRNRQGLDERVTRHVKGLCKMCTNYLSEHLKIWYY